ncbi:hypothetical protein MYP_4635 [Sporocytophaga myxococcoides]|uniref:Uncharacterized protein n=1 Tax=Sporocytophaga myxococcoides TaxID=153721 RepID=A0A098LKA9_9BACT|nr:hypothetical protein [Sporocytophaga myxococcoides]GAL87405.1 hypothetical protein MYP_4635 [Sporocytophaga myxococcoides]
MQTLQILHKNSLLNPDSIRPLNWVSSLFSSKLSEYKRYKKLKRVDYWWIEIDDKSMSIVRQIPFDVLRCPIMGLSDEKLNFKSIESLKSIDNELFNDMWSIYDKRNFKKLEQIHSKYLNNWISGDKFNPPIFPAIIIDLKYPNDIIKLETIEQLINQVDYVGYEWTDSERLIDTKGHLYKTDYLNFGHPVGVVIPYEIEKRITKEELIQLIGNQKINFKIKD